jgi:hypothetical protein
MIYTWLHLNGVDFTQEVKRGDYGLLFESIATKLSLPVAIEFVCDHYMILMKTERDKLLIEVGSFLGKDVIETEKLIHQTLRLKKKKPTEACSAS